MYVSMYECILEFFHVSRIPEPILGGGGGSIISVCVCVCVSEHSSVQTVLSVELSFAEY